MSQVLGSEELILLRWQYFSNGSTDFMHPRVWLAFLEEIKMILNFRCQFKVHEIEIGKKSIEKEQHWRTLIYLFQNFLQSYSNETGRSQHKGRYRG